MKRIFQLRVHNHYSSLEEVVREAKETMKRQQGRRGRPRMNGKQPFRMFPRILIVLNAYNKARSTGEKHSSAVTEAVAAVKSAYPDIKISETEVKRILAEYQPKDAPIVTRVTEKIPIVMSTEECKLLGIPEGTTFNRSLVVGHGPKQKYPRANAAKSKTDSIGKGTLTSG